MVAEGSVLRQDLRIGGHQQHIVEGEGFAEKAHGRAPKICILGVHPLTLYTNCQERLAKGKFNNKFWGFNLSRFSASMAIAK
jgi:hypothetical protein